MLLDRNRCVRLCPAVGLSGRPVPSRFIIDMHVSNVMQLCIYFIQSAKKSCSFHTFVSTTNKQNHLERYFPCRHKRSFLLNTITNIELKLYFWWPPTEPTPRFGYRSSGKIQHPGPNEYIYIYIYKGEVQKQPEEKTKLVKSRNRFTLKCTHCQLCSLL